MPEFILDTSGAIPGGRAVAVNAAGALKLATGVNAAPVTWSDLDAFTQGYIEALFFTENEPGTTRADRMTTRGTVRKSWAAGEREGQHKDIPGDYGFSDLAPEALARIIADCAAFQERAAGLLALAYGETIPARTFGDGTLPGAHRPAWDYDAAAAGRDFWFTRNGHGVGFWDREALNGDAPEALQTDAAEGLPRGSTSIGDNLSNLCGWRSPFGEVNPYLGDDGRVYL